jgi:cellulose synthase (UDP-forming)
MTGINSSQKNVMSSKKKDVSQSFQALYNLRYLILLLSVLFSVRYLVWRTLHTLNHDRLPQFIASTLLLGSEISGEIASLLFFLRIRKGATTEIPSPPLDPGAIPSVDIFVAIHSEPLEILYQTLVAANAIDYPEIKKRIYALDDGPRPEVMAMAQKLGCYYLTRPNNDNAKAGNINNALKFTAGELILTLDCDHIPVRSYLKETVGFFSDPKIAFVQTPHHFYNPDRFQENMRLQQELAHEQDLFFQIIQPSHNQVNSVIYAGSSCVLRRSALNEIGGIRSETAVEDMHTGMALHANGYHSAYVNKILSAGLSPESFSGYLTQRQRWTRGGVQLFLLDNPIIKPGLTTTQRFYYFASIYYFFHAIPRLIVLLAPLTFLILKWNVLVTDTWTLLGYFLPHYIFGLIAFWIYSYPYRNPFWSDVYEAASCVPLCGTVIKTLLRPEKLHFGVTSKGIRQPVSQRDHWKNLFPIIALMVLLFIGLIDATYNVAQSGIHVGAYTWNMLWAIFNLTLLGCAFEVIREHKQLRSAHRIRRSIHCELVLQAQIVFGITENISEMGALVYLHSQENLPPKLFLKLHSDYGETTEFEAHVVRNDWIEEGGSRVGLCFAALEEEQRQSLVRQIFSSPNSWTDVELPDYSFFKSTWHMITGSFRSRIVSAPSLRRQWPRIQVALPCILSANGRETQAHVQDISAIGASLFVEKGFETLPAMTLSLSLLEDENFSIHVALVRKVRIENSHVLYAVSFIAPSHLDITFLTDSNTTRSKL